MQCHQTQEELQSSFTVKQRWNNLHPYARKGIIAAIVLFIISIITTLILMAVVLSWKPTCIVTQSAAFPVAGTNQEVLVQTVDVQQKKLTKDDINFKAQVTTVRQASRLLQQDGSVPFPPIISFDDGKGVIMQAFSPSDVMYIVDPDLLISSYTAKSQSRLLQEEDAVSPADISRELEQQVWDSLLRSAATSMNADPEDLTLTYEETMTAVLKADGSYQLEQRSEQQAPTRLLAEGPLRQLRRWGGVKIPINNNANIGLINVNQNNYRSSYFDDTIIISQDSSKIGSDENYGDLNLQTVKKYGPEIAKAAGSEFSQDVQFEAAIDVTPTRLLQEDSKTDASDTKPAVSDAMLEEKRIEDQSKPVKYRRNSTKTVRIKVTNQVNINCSLYCTGNKTRRTCNKNLLKSNKCGYKTGKLTGKEKTRGRVCIRYDPEGAKAARERRQKKKEQKIQRKQQRNAVNNEANGGATPSTKVEQGKKQNTVAVSNLNQNKGGN